jgi:hypothetical protein
MKKNQNKKKRKPVTGPTRDESAQQTSPARQEPAQQPAEPPPSFSFQIFFFSPSDRRDPPVRGFPYLCNRLPPALHNTAPRRPSPTSLETKPPESNPSCRPLPSLSISPTFPSLKSPPEHRNRSP